MDLRKEQTVPSPIFTEKVQEISKLCSLNESKALVLHVGELDQNEVNSVSTLVETQLANLGVSKGIVKRIFNISIETLQNISFHADRNDNDFQMTYFIIGKHENNFTIYSGNVLPKASSIKLAERLNKLKSMTEDILKQEYLDVLSNGQLSQKGGAGLGFLTIALKSNNNIEFEFAPMNENYSLFSFKAKVII